LGGNDTPNEGGDSQDTVGLLKGIGDEMNGICIQQFREDGWRRQKIRLKAGQALMEPGF
jgi:hypothetical protein